MSPRKAPRPLRIAVVTETYPPEVNGVARTIGVMTEGLRVRGHFVQLIRPRQGAADAPPALERLETILRPGLPLPRYQELRMGLPAKRVAARGLDDHDLGAEVRERTSGHRRRLAREIGDAQSVEQRFHA